MSEAKVPRNTMMFIFAADSVVSPSLWPSDAVMLAIIGLLTIFVKDYLDRQRALTYDAKIDAVTTAVTEQAANVQKIEIATNSMKDALVEATERAALLKGADNERQRAVEVQAASIVASDLAERGATPPPIPVVVANEDPVHVTVNEVQS